MPQLTLVSEQVQGAIDWWQRLLREVGGDTFVSQANLLRAGGRSSRLTSLARRQLARRMVQEVGPAVAKRWLGTATLWSRKTIDTLVKEHSSKGATA